MTILHASIIILKGLIKDCTQNVLLSPVYGIIDYGLVDYAIRKVIDEIAKQILYITEEKPLEWFKRKSDVFEPDFEYIYE